MRAPRREGVKPTAAVAPNGLVLRLLKTMDFPAIRPKAYAFGLNASPRHRSQGWVRHPGLQFRRNRSRGRARRTIRQRRGPFCDFQLPRRRAKSKPATVLAASETEASCSGRSAGAITSAGCSVERMATTVRSLWAKAGTVAIGSGPEHDDVAACQLEETLGAYSGPFAPSHGMPPLRPS